MRFPYLAAAAFCFASCSVIKPAPEQPIRVVVGPMVMEAPVSSASKIHSFDDTPSPEREPAIRKQLIEEAELKAQRFLTTELAHRHEFTVVPFNDTRRVFSDIALDGFKPEDRINALAQQTDADVVITGRIMAYGQVPLKYWLSTYAVGEASQIAMVSVLSGGNPIAIGGFLAYDIVTDIPSWTGGFHVLGWAYRPVFVEIEAVRPNCAHPIWKKKQVVILTYRPLMLLPKEERWKKEVQLEVNLQHAMEGVALAAGRSLRLTPCETE
ncbi:MAG TPA: hypothetical protein VFA38_02640 [Nitrospirales bacterium]|nr:hypothetical protein [Nitrospirales bacterium]